ncbi:type III polyketide synthase [Microbispora sp. NPDC049125]|uniref:type III polyketide synthase n=1 Tax=Microbispora sp. NPDC049125 TaxID=3154929 RepID=UPI003465DB20
MATATATPGVAYGQDELFQGFFRLLYRDLPQAERTFSASQVKSRHLAWDPRQEFSDGFPGMKLRMQAWERNVLAMGRSSIASVLDDVERARIGTYVMASCTGYAGPSPEMLLAKEFGLRADLRRTFVGHMGCYAAFNALKVAMDAVATRPGEYALVTCAEVCSVHLRPEVSKEQMVVNSLFADACVTLLLAGDSGPGPRILRTHTETHYATSDAMSWHIQDDAFRMSLSPYVPLYLSEAIEPFIRTLLRPEGLDLRDIAHWGIHPGGPKIVEFVGQRLGLSDEQLAASLAILAEYGNCSSSTILLILDRILRRSRPQPGEYGVFMAFGPGLTMESALVQF